MPRLSIVIPYYRNPRMLFRQMLIWRDEWAAAHKSNLEVVIVDDGSPEPAADVPHVDSLPPLSIYRILVDRPWHQHAARNLGALVAKGEWIFFTDMDHVIPPDTLSKLLRLEDPAAAYTFGRVDAPSTEPWKADHASTMAPTVRDDGSLKPHVNSYAMTRAMFWQVGGYDEDYCGIYGTDQLFRTRLYELAEHKHLPCYPLVRVSRDVIPDASTRDVARKEPGRNNLKKAVARAKAQSGRAGEVTVLNFPWEKVK
jgi:glycosyltransferase involved in cell wall biosynthesis